MYLSSIYGILSSMFLLLMITNRDWLASGKRMNNFMCEMFSFLKETYRMFNFVMFLDCLTRFILNYIKNVYTLGLLIKNQGLPS